jgi:outer membrane protein OmpA-like peptidoglycan-associated protein
MRALRLLWLLPMLVLAAVPARASSPPMVFFDSGSARLSAQAELILDDAIRWLRDAGAERIWVGGYTDRVGSPSANLRLSRRRAEAVRDALVRRGFPASRIEIRALGETQMLVDTADGVAEAQNRYGIVMIEGMTSRAH